MDAVQHQQKCSKIEQMHIWNQIDEIENYLIEHLNLDKLGISKSFEKFDKIYKKVNM